MGVNEWWELLSTRTRVSGGRANGRTPTPTQNVLERETLKDEPLRSSGTTATDTDHSAEVSLEATTSVPDTGSPSPKPTVWSLSMPRFLDGDESVYTEDGLSESQLRKLHAYAHGFNMSPERAVARICLWLEHSRAQKREWTVGEAVAFYLDNFMM